MTDILSRVRFGRIHTGRIAVFVLAASWLVAWLAPTRGIYDLNYLPEIYIVAGVGLAALLSGLAKQKSSDSPALVSWLLMGPLLLLMGLISVTALMATDGSIYRELLLGPVVGLSCAVLSIVLFDWMADNQDIRFDQCIELTVVLGGVLTAWTVLVQVGLMLDPVGLVILPPLGTVPFANFFQRNHAALLMSMAVIVMLAGYRSSGTASKVARFVAIILLGICIILTQSRAGLLLAVTGGVLVLILSDRAGSGWKSHIGSISVVACVSVLLQWSVEVGLSDLLAASATHGVLDRFSTGEGLIMRLHIMLHGLKQWGQSPILGGGWGSHPGWLFENALALSWPRFSTNTHNIVTQLLAETGLVGTIPVVFALVVVAARCWRHRIWRLNERAAMYVTLVLMLVLHSMVEYPLWNLYFLVPFLWFLVNLLHSCSSADLGGSGYYVDQAVMRLIRGGAGILMLVTAVGLLVLIMNHVDQRVRSQQAFAAGQALPADVATDSTYFADVLRHASPISSDHLAHARIKIGGRLVATTPMDWIIERLAIDQALAGQIDASVVSYQRLCAMYRHRCDETLKRLDVIAGKVSALAEVHARLAVIRSHAREPVP